MYLGKLFVHYFLEGGKQMAYSTRYGKPNMTNLPSDLGMKIFKEILEAPKPDYARMQEDATRLEKEMIEIRKRENAQRITSN